MVPEPWSATQTDPGPATSAAGPRPTRIVAVTAEVARSIRETVASALLATHSEPSPTASAAGSAPTRTRASTCPETGASFSTVAVPYPATQIAWPATAIALGCRSTGSVRCSDPVAGSISASWRAAGSATHTRPTPTAMAPGWAHGRVIVWVTLSVAGSILLTAAPHAVPPALFEQLSVGGRLIAPVGPEGRQIGRAHV